MGFPDQMGAGRAFHPIDQYSAVLAYVDLRAGTAIASWVMTVPIPSLGKGSQVTFRALGGGPCVGWEAAGFPDQMGAGRAFHPLTNTQPFSDTSILVPEQQCR
ncbi:hypothetical protein GCM10022226_48000 [Sphaerisporangium flaviroseum]|uniref:Uncharacterized protein n=1 Tax=Sphaerisporangium flaviroseum TaxID=509199 RepID=A0ABP7IMX9_9ACTN